VSQTSGRETHLGLGVAHRRNETGNVLAETLSDLVLRRHAEHPEELERAHLALPLRVRLKVDEEGVDELGRNLGRRKTLELFGGLLGGVLDRGCLARLDVLVEDGGEEGEEVRVGSAESESGLAEELVESDHGSLLLLGVLGLGSARQLVENAVIDERLEAVRDDVGRDGRSSGGAAGAVDSAVEVLEEGGRSGRVAADVHQNVSTL